MPVKNEEADIERVLKSFRGVADEIVIGVDDQSTDRTREIATWYADKVFDFTWEKSFSKARNACMDQCTGDWIFMSEGHEHLHSGVDALLRLDEIPSFIDVVEVKRESRGCLWQFPWLSRNKPEIRYTNDVHNVLSGYDPKRVAQAHQIHTWHERAENKEIERNLQRKGMNPQVLLNRIIKSKNRDLQAMFYLAGEYSNLPGPENFKKAIKWYQSYIDLSIGEPMCYQARLALGKLLFRAAKRLEKANPGGHDEQITLWLNQAKKTLCGATADDPMRVEHWLLLGEISEAQGQLYYAMRFYEYAALGIGRVPTSYMFIDKGNYTYLPAQRLVNVYLSLGQTVDALMWHKRSKLSCRIGLRPKPLKKSSNT
jgi:glycosyltransferase involved in cell wall biosynthesis